MIQEDYEVTPDEKRKSRGEKIIKTFLSKQVRFKVVKIIKVAGMQYLNVL